MEDYIDRQTIIEAIHSAMYSFFCGAEDGDILSADEKLMLSVNKAICTAIKALPSADAVEVVRCSDCKHSYESVAGWICSYGVCVDCVVRDDFYCSFGERKDG